VSTAVIALEGVGKTYAQYRHGVDRLVEAVFGVARRTDHVALQPLNLQIDPGEVLGLVGMNGAGKSTLLKLLAGTLTPSCGRLEVQGRVAALLELGTGFHPEMSGRDNVLLAGAVMGLPRAEIERRYPQIVDFAGLHDFMDQPVKTYSSGMFVRLAFAVATSVDPDVLIVDEALSVGDGAFARKSFDRIMGFKKAGKTILFCSHSLYQVEAICTRVLWIHQGRLMMDGDPGQVTAAYNAFLGSESAKDDLRNLPSGELQEGDQPLVTAKGHAKISAVEVSAGGLPPARELDLTTEASDLLVDITFASDPRLPPPTVGVAIAGPDGRFVASASTRNDGLVVPRAPDGAGRVRLSFPGLPLLKGRYWVNAYLLCEQAIHVYDQADAVAELRIRQRPDDLQQGVVSLRHRWDLDAAASS
jgi:lipopolysaccharide transport system ATP-binding protein